MHSEFIVDVARIIVGVVVVEFDRVEFSGLYIYRGSAAQIFVELSASLEMNS